MWTRERFIALARSPKVIITASSVLSAVAGSAAGYVVAQKKLEAKYKLIVEKEIEEAKEFYSRLHPIIEKPMSPEQVLASLHGAETAADALLSYQGGDPVAPEEETDDDLVDQELEKVAESKAAKIHNIFDKARPVDEDDWNYEIELRIRDENPDRPYIIHHDEFFEGEKDYEQVSLTYFEGDDVLADDREVPVPDSDATVGDDNLIQFGHGSKDKNMVYIRNDAREMDFEVALSKGSYSKEVLGFDDDDSELKHSYSSQRKFRGHDE